MLQKHGRDSGLTLVEMILYLAITAILFVVIVNMSLLFGSSQSRLATARVLNRSATISLERMIYEMTRADSVDIGASSLGVDQGVLALNTTNGEGDPVVDKLYITDGALTLEEDGVVAGALTESGARTTSLVFNRITTSGSEAVRVALTLEAGSGPSVRAETFYTTVILRHSY
ncbi:hypothetical protein L0Y40_02830 [Candidatus Wolfebacteria bacterium]|nr:hypothetical protein [Candidatus Wolfebacteria bacterium]